MNREKRNQQVRVNMAVDCMDRAIQEIKKAMEEASEIRPEWYEACDKVEEAIKIMEKED